MEVPGIGFLLPPEPRYLRDEARGLLAVGPAARPVSRLVVPAWTQDEMDNGDLEEISTDGEPV